MSLFYTLPVLEAIQDDGIITPQNTIDIVQSIAVSMVSTIVFMSMLSIAGKVLDKEQRKPLKLLKYTKDKGGITHAKIKDSL
jgi:hypothetical protein